VTRFAPAGPLIGALRPPPDKSISHRAALVGAMGEGETEVRDYLDAADTRATLEAIRRLGAGITEVGEPGSLHLRVRGVGLRGPAPAEIDVANAGTLLRILPGWLAGQPSGSWVLDGDESIRRRPVDRVAEPLGLMGATVECRERQYPPLRVTAGALRGIDYRLPVASAQVKSCILLAGLLAEGETRVTESAVTRDHTERILAAAGVDLQSVDPRTTPLVGGGVARRITVRPADRLDPRRIEVPGDFSSAAFLVVAAALVAGSAVRLEGVGLNPTRVGLLGILNRMGAAVEVEEDPADGAEPRGAIVARHSTLAATRVHPDEVPIAIDELPLVALLGCFAEGTTVVSGAAELRHKESDRIATVVDGLRGAGAEIEATEDGFAVRGTGGLHGGRLDAGGDHRLAMLGAVAGLASREGVEVVGMDAAAVSYPGFTDHLAALLAGA
jgi:3-phosphoshikimate 1-carboxyvinyltransferase